MLLWLQNNLGTIVVAALLLVAIFFVVRKITRDKKAGKSSCGCGCGSCSLSGKCHAVKSEHDEKQEKP